MKNTYRPEGYFINTPENNEYTDSLAGLYTAMEKGIILEAPAVLCDSQHNLYVDLGRYRAVIPKEETLYCPDGGEIKDIAIITRVGKSVCFVIKEIVKDDGVKIVVSRRLAQKKCFDEYVHFLSCGDIIEAKITHMEQFGCFCDIGCGLIGLLPIDCISVSRIRHPSERFECGQIIKCAVKSIEEATNRITLTHKELLGTWQENADGFLAGETVAGIVRSIEPYGIFVELTPNLAGLAEWCTGVEEGDIAAVYIKSIIPEKMKIKLAVVDTSCTESVNQSRYYFYGRDHIDEWRYSPDVCPKEIITRFGRA